MQRYLFIPITITAPNPKYAPYVSDPLDSETNVNKKQNDKYNGATISGEEVKRFHNTSPNYCNMTPISSWHEAFHCRMDTFNSFIDIIRFKIVVLYIIYA